MRETRPISWMRNSLGGCATERSREGFDPAQPILSGHKPALRPKQCKAGPVRRVTGRVFLRRPLEFCRRRIETSPMVVEGAELSLGAQNKSLIQEKHRGQGSYAGHVPRRTTTFTTLSRREVWYKSQTKVVVTRDVFCEGGRPCALRLPGPALGVLSAFPLPNIASECLHPLGPHLFTPVPNQTPQT